MVDTQWAKFTGARLVVVMFGHNLIGLLPEEITCGGNLPEIDRVAVARF